jgi:hypothetical protein
VVGPPDRTLDEVPVVFVTMATDDPAVVDRIEAACAHANVGFFLQTYAHVLGNDDREAAEQAASFLIGDGWNLAEDDETIQHSQIRSQPK